MNNEKLIVSVDTNDCDNHEAVRRLNKMLSAGFKFIDITHDVVTKQRIEEVLDKVYVDTVTASNAGRGRANMLKRIRYCLLDDTQENETQGEVSAEDTDVHIFVRSGTPPIVWGFACNCKADYKQYTLECKERGEL